MELVELMTPRSAKEDEKTGRQSGSLAWRLARGETGKAGKIENVNKVWTPTAAERESLCLELEYDVLRDEYTRSSDCREENLKGFASGADEVENIFRKVEHDWGQVYLARTGVKKK